MRTRRFCGCRAKSQCLVPGATPTTRGAGALSACNPTTGSYAHDSAVLGPGATSANASGCNARTDLPGSTSQNSNAHGRCGSSTVSRPNQTVHPQSQSNARGSAGSFRSSTAASCLPRPLWPRRSGRGFDGAATVEVRWPGSTLRRILFAKGLPVASDATVPLARSRDGDLTVAKIGTDERYAIRDALARGG
jgi:hypothetical protein